MSPSLAEVPSNWKIHEDTPRAPVLSPIRETREMAVSFEAMRALNVSDPSWRTVATYGLREKIRAKSTARTAAPMPMGLPESLGMAETAIKVKKPTNTGG